MKKKLEAELISIAHRILQMKNRDDLEQLHREALHLYEKLSVLRFVEENLADVKPTIGYQEIEEKLSDVFDQPLPADGSVPKKEAINEIISVISDNAAKSQPQATQVSESEAAEAETGAAALEQPEPVAELDPSDSEQAQQSPGEAVAPVEVEATQQAEPEVSETEIEKEPEVAAEVEVKAEPEPEITPSEPQKPVADELFKPAFELAFEAKPEEIAAEVPTASGTTQITFDDLLGQDYKDPVFVKPEEIENRVAETPSEEPKLDTSVFDKPIEPQPEAKSEADKLAEIAEANRRRIEDLKSTAAPETARPNVIPISRNFVDTGNVIPIHKSENLNDRMGKGLTIGLNDRVAFMKHLFNNSSEDYNRVLSQLITFDTLDEAKNFIDTIVKPDYNNWEGKDEYEQRFMEIIEKRFL